MKATELYFGLNPFHIPVGDRNGMVITVRSYGIRMAYDGETRDLRERSQENMGIVSILSPRNFSPSGIFPLNIVVVICKVYGLGIIRA